MRVMAQVTLTLSLPEKAGTSGIPTNTTGGKVSGLRREAKTETTAPMSTIECDRQDVLMYSVAGYPIVGVGSLAPSKALDIRTIH